MDEQELARRRETMPVKKKGKRERLPETLRGDGLQRGQGSRDQPLMTPQDYYGWTRCFALFRGLEEDPVIHAFYELLREPEPESYAKFVHALYETGRPTGPGTSRSRFCPWKPAA